MEFLLTSESERGRSPSSKNNVGRILIDEKEHRRTVDRVLLFLALTFQPSIV